MIGKYFSGPVSKTISKGLIVASLFINPGAILTVSSKDRQRREDFYDPFQEELARLLASARYINHEVQEELFSSFDLILEEPKRRIPPAQRGFNFKYSPPSYRENRPYQNLVSRIKNFNRSGIRSSG